MSTNTKHGNSRPNNLRNYIVVVMTAVIFILIFFLNLGFSNSRNSLYIEQVTDFINRPK